MSNKKGLTLIELLAVIAIIAILFVLLIPQINSAIEKARHTGTMTDFRSYQLALQTYHIKNSSLPSDESTINEYLDKPLSFSNNVSSKKGAYNEPYSIEFYSNEVIVSTKNKDKSYSIRFTTDADGSLSFVTEGLQFSEQKSNTNNEGSFSSTEEDSACDSRNLIETPSSEFSYTNIGGGIRIDKYNGSAKDIVIPCFIDGFPVTKIASYDVYNEGAFYGKGIKSLILPDSIVEIGNHAFQANDINNVIFPKNLTDIGNYAFFGNQLTDVMISSSTTSVSSGAFSGNPNVTFVIDDNHPTLKTDENRGGLYSKDGSVIYVGSARSVNTPTFSKVSVIEYGSFYAMNITSLTIPNTVVKIVDSAFAENPIKSLHVPSSVKTIERAAFYLNEIETLTFDEGIQEIGGSAFYEIKLGTLNLPNSLLNIGEGAFHNSGITDLKLPDNIKNIAATAFSNNQITELTIPSSLESIGERAFYYNENLKTVTNLSNNPLSGIFNSNPRIN